MFLFGRLVEAFRRTPVSPVGFVLVLVIVYQVRFRGVVRSLPLVIQGLRGLLFRGALLHPAVKRVSGFSPQLFRRRIRYQFGRRFLLVLLLPGGLVAVVTAAVVVALRAAVGPPAAAAAPPDAHAPAAAADAVVAAAVVAVEVEVVPARGAAGRVVPVGGVGHVIIVCPPTS